jgi:hypothetical protein
MRLSLESISFLMILSFGPEPALSQTWNNYKLINGNQFHDTLSDVMGPFGLSNSARMYSVPDQILWKYYGVYLRPKARYEDLGGACDLYNPNLQGPNQVGNPNNPSGDFELPFPNRGNGLFSNDHLQSGTFTACGLNTHNSQGSLSGKPYLTRAAWIYRSCKMLTVRANSCQIARFSNRIKRPAHSSETALSSDSLVSAKETLDSDSGQTPQDVEPNCNWCNMISRPSLNDIQDLFMAFYGRNLPSSALPSLGKDSTKANLDSSSGSATIQSKTIGLSRLTTKGDSPSFQEKVLSKHPELSSPGYYEHLVELLAASDQFIDQQIASSYLAFVTSKLEGSAICNSTPQSTSIQTPTLEQLKAVNQWRALLFTFCSDPGWNIE